jgi:hypothetical protein
MYTPEDVGNILGGRKNYKELLDKEQIRIGSNPIASKTSNGHIQGSTAKYFVPTEKEGVYNFQIRRDYLLEDGRILVGYSDATLWDIPKYNEDFSMKNPVNDLSADLDNKIAEYLNNHNLKALEWIDLRPFEDLT